MFYTSLSMTACVCARLFIETEIPMRFIAAINHSSNFRPISDYF